MLPVSGRSQSQAACEGSGAGSRDGPRWGVRPPTPQSPRGPKAQAEQGLSWGPSTVPNTASDEPGLGRLWVPGEASCSQEGVLEPPEKMHGLFKLSEGNSDALEKKW